MGLRREGRGCAGGLTVPDARRTFPADPPPGPPMTFALPSLGTAVSGAQRALRRFPLAILAAAVATVASILAMEDLGPEWSHARLLTAACLGIPLFIAATLLAERQARRGLAALVLGAVGVLVLAGYFAGWPRWNDPVRAGRFVQLDVAFVLFVVFVPFARTGRLNAFWQFNRTLLERAILAAIFSGTLFLGLALALAALDKLFGVDGPGTAYGRVWVVVAFLFNTWFFLGGMPEDPLALEERRDYPAVLRIFAQYALVPLVSIYLLILTIYLFKVVFTWNWPNGWIGWLVSGVAGAGILSLLLVHPIADDPEQRWIGTFARQFWLALIPSIVMLWLAIWQRVHQYGITERRYFLIVLSLWLAAMAVYYAVTRSRNIRIIPVTLCIGALLTFAGPWSAYAVSQASQVGRLLATLERNGMLEGGAVRRPARAVSDSDRTEISAIVRYLVETHGTRALGPWFADTVARRSVLAAGERARRDPGSLERWADTVVARLGLPYASRVEVRRGVRRFAYTQPDPAEIPVRGFDLEVPIREQALALPDSVCQAVWSREPLAIRVVRSRDTLVVLPLDSMRARLRARDARAPRAASAPGTAATPRADLFVTDAQGRGGRARAYVRFIEERDSAGTRRVATVAGRVLVALK